MNESSPHGEVGPEYTERSLLEGNPRGFESEMWVQKQPTGIRPKPSLELSLVRNSFSFVFC